MLWVYVSSSNFCLGRGRRYWSIHFTFSHLQSPKTEASGIPKLWHCGLSLSVPLKNNLNFFYLSNVKKPIFFHFGKALIFVGIPFLCFESLQKICLYIFLQWIPKRNEALVKNKLSSVFCFYFLFKIHNWTLIVFASFVSLQLLLAKKTQCVNFIVLISNGIFKCGLIFFLNYVHFQKQFKFFFRLAPFFKNFVILYMFFFF